MGSTSKLFFELSDSLSCNNSMKLRVNSSSSSSRGVLSQHLQPQVVSRRRGLEINPSAQPIAVLSVFEYN